MHPERTTGQQGAGPRVQGNGAHHEALEGLLDHLSDGMLVFDREWRFRYVNEPGAKMLGRRSAADLTNRVAWDEFPEAVGGRSYQAYHRARHEQRSVQFTEFLEPLERLFEVRIFPVGDELVVLFRDVTDESEARRQLTEFAEHMAEAERIARFGVWHWDLASDEVSWSDQLHLIYGIDPGEFAGTVEDFAGRLHPDDRERVWGHIHRAVETLEPFAFEERIVWPGGDVRHLLSQGRAIAGPDGKAAALVAVCHDITERVHVSRALGRTEQRMRAIIDNVPSFVAVKDLDGRYLMANAQAGRVVGHPPEDMVGQECLDLFPEQVAQQLCANDRRAINDGHAIFDEMMVMHEGEPRTFVTVTFTLPDEDGRPTEVCTIGTDVTEQREHDSERRERNRWRRRIGEALSEGRMVLHSQPVVAIDSGRTESSELLIRMWDEGQDGTLLQPAAFLPAAERHGMIQAIDAWVVGRALELASTNFRPQVNLSAVTLGDPAAIMQIFDLLGEAEPDAARRLVFEITETAALEHLDAAINFAQRATELGCGLALDDFGTGFGSFTYLRRLPLRYLKIDRSFVAGVTDSIDDRRVVQCIIGIAEQFGLQTIAEGVEDQATLEMLGKMGSDFAQGFHVARPGPLPVGASADLARGT